MAFICSECDWVDPSSVLPSHCPVCGEMMRDMEVEILQDEMEMHSCEKKSDIGVARALCGNTERLKETTAIKGD